MPREETQLSKEVKREVKRLDLKLSQITQDSIFNANQVQKIYNSTPGRYTFKRPGRGGGEWTYAKAGYMRDRANAIFGFNWDFEVLTPVSEAFEVAKATGSCVVLGKFTGRVKHDGQSIPLVKTQYGRADVKFKKDTRDPLDFGNDLKAAATDAFKKCLASGLGLARDIYDSDEDFLHIRVLEADQDDEKDENVKKMIEENKKLLDEENA